MAQSNMPPIVERRGNIVARIQAFRALRHGNYRFLWSHQWIATLAMGVEQVAFSWQVLELTDSPFMLGAVASIRGLPLLVFGIVGGVVADRFDRRKLIIVAAGMTVSLTFLMAILTSSGLIRVWHIFIISLVGGTISAFNMPTRQAFVFDLVGQEDLTNAIALNFIAMGVTRIIGPSIGGILVGFVRVAGCYYVAGVVEVLAIALLFLIQPVERVMAARRESIWRNLSDGFGYLRRHTTVLALLSMEILLDLFAFSYNVLLPVFARDILGVGAEGLGFLTGAAGIGSLMGSLGIASKGDFQRKGLVLLVSAIGFGIMLLLFALSPWYVLSLALLIGVGAMATTYDVLMVSLLQTIVPDDLRGRIMGMYTWVISSVHLGCLQMGAVASLLGAPLAVGLGGAVTGLAVLGLAKAQPGLRRLR